MSRTLLDRKRADLANLGWQSGTSGSHPRAYLYYDTAPETGLCYFDTVMADAPVWYARLGEPSGTTATDEIGTNDGTYQGAPTLGTPGALPGDSNTAVTLDGAGTEYISVPDDAALDLGDGPLTYEIWFKRTNAGANSGGLISKGAGMPILLIDDTSLGSLDWSSRGVGGGADGTVFITDTTTWHHIVGTKALAGAWLLYVDGADATSTVGTPTTTNNATEMNIGRDNGGVPGSYVQGIIDEVAIYNYVLSPAQVAAHYDARTVACGGDTFDPATIAGAIGDDPLTHRSVPQAWPQPDASWTPYVPAAAFDPAPFAGLFGEGADTQQLRSTQRRWYTEPETASVPTYSYDPKTVDWGDATGLIRSTQVRWFDASEAAEPPVFPSLPVPFDPATVDWGYDPSRDRPTMPTWPTLDTGGEWTPPVTRLWPDKNGTRGAGTWAPVQPSSSWEFISASAIVGPYLLNPVARTYEGSVQGTTQNLGGTAGDDSLLAWFISPPLNGPHRLDGFVRGMLARALESNAAADARTQIVIRVVDFNGLTVRGTLYAGDTGGLVSELDAVTATARRMPQVPGQLTPVDALSGDRIVVEIGARQHASAASTAQAYFGTLDVVDADVPDDETFTGQGRTWIEFTGVITFAEELSPAWMYDPQPWVSTQVRWYQADLETPWAPTATGTGPVAYDPATVDFGYDAQQDRDRTQRWVEPSLFIGEPPTYPTLPATPPTTAQLAGAVQEDPLAGRRSPAWSFNGDVLLGVHGTPEADTPPVSSGCFFDTVMATAPVWYARLGESSGTTAFDEIASLDGTYANAPTLGATGLVTSDTNTAVTLNGTDEYIAVPDSAALDVGDSFSLAGLFRRTGGDGTARYFFSKGDLNFAIRLASNNKLTFQIQGVADLCDNGVAITDSLVHFFVATKDGATHRLYLDGVDVTTNIGTATATDNSTELNVGRDNQAAPGSYWLGDVDEPVIWDRALTNAEQYAMFTALTVPCGYVPAIQNDVQQDRSTQRWYDASLDASWTPYVVTAPAFDPATVDWGYDPSRDRSTQQRWIRVEDDTLGIPPFAPTTATVAQQAGEWYDAQPWKSNAVDWRQAPDPAEPPVFPYLPVYTPPNDAQLAPLWGNADETQQLKPTQVRWYDPSVEPRDGPLSDWFMGGGGVIGYRTPPVLINALTGDVYVSIGGIFIIPAH